MCLCFTALDAATAQPSRDEVVARQQALRGKLREMLGIPTGRCDLAPESRGQIERDGVVIEKWVWTTEPGSKTPAVVYRPKDSKGKLPAIVLTYGHGGSKRRKSDLLLAFWTGEGTLKGSSPGLCSGSACRALCPYRLLCHCCLPCIPTRVLYRLCDGYAMHSPLVQTALALWW